MTFAAQHSQPAKHHNWTAYVLYTTSAPSADLWMVQ
jgi:hypothetical protein